MSDVINDKSVMMPEGDVPAPSERIMIKYTAKGLAYQIEKIQAGRRAKCKQASKYLKRLQQLTKSNKNVSQVQHELFIRCYEEARYEHESFLALPITTDEI